MQEGLQAPSSQPWGPCGSWISPQPPVAAPSAVLSMAVRNPAFRERVLSCEQMIASHFLQHQKSVEWGPGATPVSQQEQEHSGPHGLSPRAALAIVHLLLSPSEASWHSPVWSAAFLFGLFCLPQRHWTESVLAMLLSPGWECHAVGTGACPEAGTEGSESVQKASGMTFCLVLFS